jgi:hypothetical protein
VNFPEWKKDYSQIKPPGRKVFRIEKINYLSMGNKFNFETDTGNEICLPETNAPERGHNVPELERIHATGFREIHFKPHRIIIKLLAIQFSSMLYLMVEETFGNFSNVDYSDNQRISTL